MAKLNVMEVDKTKGVTCRECGSENFGHLQYEVYYCEDCKTYENPEV